MTPTAEKASTAVIGNLDSENERRHSKHHKKIIPSFQNLKNGRSLI